jgi:hypothetical protein
MPEATKQEVVRRPEWSEDALEAVLAAMRPEERLRAGFAAKSLLRIARRDALWREDVAAELKLLPDDKTREAMRWRPSRPREAPSGPPVPEWLVWLRARYTRVPQCLHCGYVDTGWSEMIDDACSGEVARLMSSAPHWTEPDDWTCFERLSERLTCARCRGDTVVTFWIYDSWSNYDDFWDDNEFRGTWEVSPMRCHAVHGGTGSSASPFRWPAPV